MGPLPELFRISLTNPFPAILPLRLKPVEHLRLTLPEIFQPLAPQTLSFFQELLKPGFALLAPELLQPFPDPFLFFLNRLFISSWVRLFQGLEPADLLQKRFFPSIGVDGRRRPIH